MIESELIDAIADLTVKLLDEYNEGKEVPIGFATLLYIPFADGTGINISYVGTMDAPLATNVMGMFASQINEEMEEQHLNGVN